MQLTREQEKLLNSQIQKPANDGLKSANLKLLSEIKDLKTENLLMKKKFDRVNNLAISLRNDMTIAPPSRSSFHSAVRILLDAILEDEK